MYRRVLRVPPPLRPSTSTTRHTLCYRHYSYPRSRYYSTPTQTQDRQTPAQRSTQDVDSAENTTGIPRQETLLDDAPRTPPTPPEAGQPEGSTSAGGPNPEEVKARMKEWTHATLKDMRQRGDEFTVKVAKTFAQLGAELNRVTGYEEIEVLKRKVVEQESRIYNAREAARQAKDAYDMAVLQRAKSQREVNDLLQRKSHWSDEDVSRFTTLVREDHAREHDEGRAKAAAAAAEDAVEREFSELMRVILNRYHEEQAWSDKIRSASTYGQLTVLALNMLVFVLAIILVEPWKRRRLAQTFERKVDEMCAQISTAFEERTGALAERVDEQAKLLTAVLETVQLAKQVSSAELEEIERMEAREKKEQPVEGARIPAVPKSEQEFLLFMTASAAAAGILGWLARSWYG